MKLAAFNAYGGVICSCPPCGVTEEMMLTIDHPKGDGGKHREKIGGGGYKMYLWLKRNNYPKGYRVLCFNCNASRQFNSGVCPHLKEMNK